MEIKENSLAEKSLEEEREREEEEKRSSLLEAVANSSLNTLEQRVAWLLNHHPRTRDSDICLLIKYWRHFEAKYLDGEYINLDNLYQTTRLTSLTRSRAKIQNNYKLFLASPEVRKQRGKLSEEERERITEKNRDLPVYAIYADESKSSEFIVVGSMWILDGIGTLKLSQAIKNFKNNNKFSKEFHFKEIRQGDLDVYLGLIDLVKEESSAIGFKALSVPSRGLGKVQDVLEDLFYHLIMRGVDHEQRSGRAPLPRYIQFWKDAEEPGADKILLANLESRIEADKAGRFEESLLIDQMTAVDSSRIELLQIADLFTSSIARCLNTPGENTKPKDIFARRFLEMFGLGSPQRERTSGELDCMFYESV